ncbi:MAG: FKBP-type peptidyl-prolyl cis-trans isomerase [Proteobacteria bacterium]|nr:FKBP-type peptidyl-prolyl cis-trans isomerase [Pseudomonadota bacterium]
MTDSFLSQNAENADVVTTASGLQFRVLKEGKGKSPKSSDTVTVHYEGRLTNGNIFDSSYQRGKPTQFKVNAVIKGWTEALLSMKKGSKWEIFIPPELAYGSKGVPGVIPPNSVLIFKVELIKTKGSLFGF